MRPLWAKIIMGAAAGMAAGLALGTRAAPLGEAGMLVIRLLKTLATPLILFAVLDAFLRTYIPGRKALVLVGLSAMNAVVAIGIGLSAAHLVRGGESWRSRMGEIQAALAAGHTATAVAPAPAPGASLSLLTNLARYVPANLVDPFRENSVISVIMLAVLGGLSLRALKGRGGRAEAAALEGVAGLVQVAFRALTQMLEWAIRLVPFAVFGVIAAVVGAMGANVMGILGIFLATMALGLVLHGVGWYSLLLWTVGRMSPFRFFRAASDSIVTALSCSSSLATLPVTLRCLDENLAVSPASARLAVCVGTNINHDGIILYEAAAAIFMLQAFGLPAGLGVQLGIAAAAVMAGIGIAGVPEAGLITLPLVLGAAGLPEAAGATVIPLILPVDWILGRFRAAVNVTSDMTVAVLLDRLDRKG